MARGLDSSLLQITSDCLQTVKATLLFSSGHSVTVQYRAGREMGTSG